MRGSVTKKRDRWYVVLSLPPDPATGKRRREWSKGYATRDEAERERTRLLGERDNGTYVERSSLTLTAWVDLRLPLLRSKLRPSTLASYEATLRKHVLPRLGRLALQDLRMHHIEAMREDLLANGRHGGGPLAPRTVQYAMVVLSRLLRDAHRQGLIVRNPCDGVDKPTVRRPELHPWSAEQAGAFLTATRGDRLAGLWTLALTTGMRRGELCGLRWQDVTFDAFDGSRIAVRHTRVRGNAYGEVFDSTPKTRSSVRSVSLDGQTVAVLKRHRARQAAEQLAAGPAWADTGYAFTNELGQPLHPDYLRQRFTRLTGAVGLPVIRFHDLRHTYATVALANGVHPKVVSSRLGHSTIAITLDTYSHVLPGLDEAGAERVASAMFGPEANAAGEL